MFPIKQAAILFDLQGTPEIISEDSIKTICRSKTASSYFFVRICKTEYRHETYIHNEIRFLEILKQSGFSSMNVKKSINGLSTEIIQFEGSRYIINCFQEINGHHIRFHEFNEDLFYKTGELSAQLHQRSKSLNDENTRLELPYLIDKQIEFITNHRSSISDKMYTTSNQIVNMIRSLNKTNDTYGIIHSDLTRSNILIQSGNLHLIDLGDVSYSWFLHDTAISLYDSFLHGSIKESNYRKFACNYMQYYWMGYKKHRTPEEHIIEMIPAFMHLRAIHDHTYLLEIWNGIELNADRISYQEKIKNMAIEGFSFLHSIYYS